MTPQERSALLQDIQSHMRRNDMVSAREPCAALLEANPNDVDGLAIDGLIKFTTGYVEEAEVVFRRLIEIRPGNPEDHFNLARVLTRRERVDEAIKEFDEALRIRPDNLRPVEGKAQVLVIADRKDEAKALLKDHISKGDDLPSFGLILGTIAEQAGEYSEAVDIIERYAGSSKADAPTNRQLFLLLGRALEKLERYDDAFRAFRRGNAYGAMPYDREGFMDRVERTKRIFSRKNMKSMPKSGIDSELPVFVTSMPRSGSTLVERVIDAHSQAKGVGEIIVMHRVALESPNTLKTQRPYPDCIETATRKGLQTLGRQYLDEAEKLADGADRIVDKTLETWQHVGLVQMALPNARVINVRRHPMDTCLSCYMAALNPTVHTFAATLEDLAYHYRAYDTLCKHWAEAANIDYMEIRYEDFVDDQERWTHDIIDFCGLPWEDGCLEHHKRKSGLVMTLSYDQVRRPVYKSALARWKRYEKHLGPLQSLIGDLVKEYDA
jgi:tetratricopeptide (TPR) repeat protein